MPRQQTRQQKKTVERVMHEFKHGELETARGKRKVRNPQQAVAIALHEAGASKYEDRRKNEANLRRTKAKERRGETGRDAAEGRGSRRKTAPSAGRRPAGAKGQTPSRTPSKTRAVLYEEAKRRDIPGRSRMTKAALRHALGG